MRHIQRKIGWSAGVVVPVVPGVPVSSFSGTVVF